MGGMPSNTCRADAPALLALTNAIQPARRAWTQLASQRLQNFGQPLPLAIAVLIAARHADGVQQGSLAQTAGVNPGAIVRTVDQGEEAGLLERRAVPGDRRAKRIYVSPAGAKLATKMEAVITVLRAELFGELTMDEVDTALRVLRVVTERSSLALAGQSEA